MSVSLLFLGLIVLVLLLGTISVVLYKSISDHLLLVAAIVGISAVVVPPGYPPPVFRLVVLVLLFIAHTYLPWFLLIPRGYDKATYWVTRLYPLHFSSTASDDARLRAVAALVACDRGSRANLYAHPEKQKMNTISWVTQAMIEYLQGNLALSHQLLELVHELPLSPALHRRAYEFHLSSLLSRAEWTKAAQCVQSSQPHKNSAMLSFISDTVLRLQHTSGAPTVLEYEHEHAWAQRNPAATNWYERARTVRLYEPIDAQLPTTIADALALHLHALKTPEQELLQRSLNTWSSLAGRIGQAIKQMDDEARLEDPTIVFIGQAKRELIEAATNNQITLNTSDHHTEDDLKALKLEADALENRIEREQDLPILQEIKGFLSLQDRYRRVCTGHSLGSHLAFQAIYHCVVDLTVRLHNDRQESVPAYAITNWLLKESHRVADTRSAELLESNLAIISEGL